MGNYHPDTHDWHYLLRAIGLLGSEGFIAGCCRLASLLAILAGLAVGVWLVVEMALAIRRPHQG